MDITTFWKLVESARDDDPDTATERLEKLLFDLTPEQLTDFYRHFEKCYQACNLGALWAAAGILNGGSASDDVFEYFRYWLISQGRTVYEAALQNPDTLTEVIIPLEEDVPSAQNEDYGYVAQDVYADLTGEEIYDAIASDDVDQDEEPEEWDWQEYTEKHLQKVLPKLWTKYGAFYRPDEEVDVSQYYVQEQFVEGVGLIKIGDVAHHKYWGEAVIERICSIFPMRPSVTMRFIDDGREKVMPIDADGVESGIWTINRAGD